MSQAKGLIFVTDGEIDAPDGPCFVQVNDEMGRIAKKPAEALVGCRLALSGLPPTAIRNIEAQCRDAARRREMIEVDLDAVDRQGRRRWVKSQTIPVFDAEGKLQYILGIGRDITEQRMAETERETTQRLLASVFGTIDQALAVIDDLGRFVMVNNAVTRKLGWGVFDLIGKPFTDLIDEALRSAVEQELRALAQNGQTCRVTTRLRHRDGRISLGELAETAIPQADDRHYRVISLTVTDPDQGPSVPVGFESAVRKALSGAANSGIVIAGKLQLIGLKAVREHLGERWPRLSERIVAVAEQILRHHLTAADVFTRTADEGFLVCFPELSESEARVKAAVIGQEIRERLIGVMPEGSPELAVESFVSAVAVAGDDPEMQANVIQAMEQRLARERKRIEKTAQDTLRTGLATERVCFSVVRTASNHPAPLALAEPPRESAGALEAAEALGHPGFAIETEIFLLAGCYERLLGELSQGKSEMIMVPVRLATLSRRRDAERWLQLGRTLGNPGRVRLIAEICDINRDIARVRLTDLMMMLASLFRGVAFELPTANPDFVNSLPQSAALLTLPLRHLTGEGGAIQLNVLGKLIKKLENRQCRLIVKGVATPAQALSLSKAGVGFMATTHELV